jgi:hypothetical protein
MRSAFLAIATFLALATTPVRAQPFCAPASGGTCPFGHVGENGHLVGDPIDVVYDNVFNRHVDISLPSTTGTFEFTRFYNSNWSSWTSGTFTELDNVSETPAPFGGVGQGLLYWWHNYYSFVTDSVFVASPGTVHKWAVRDREAFVHYFGSCTSDAGSDCAAPVDTFQQPSIRTSLHSNGAGFTFVQEDGTSLVFDGTAVFLVRSPHGVSATRYFLTSVVNPQGATTATISYAPPTDESNTALTDCAPSGLAGTTSGVPYIRSITSAEGNRLVFYYQAIPSRFYVGNDCVITAIKLQDRGGGPETLLARYTTVAPRAGELGAVTLPFRAPDGTGTYDQGNLQVPFTYT